MNNLERLPHDIPTPNKLLQDSLLAAAHAHEGASTLAARQEAVGALVSPVVAQSLVCGRAVEDVDDDRVRLGFEDLADEAEGGFVHG